MPQIELQSSTPRPDIPEIRVQPKVAEAQFVCMTYLKGAAQVYGIDPLTLARTVYEFIGQELESERIQQLPQFTPSVRVCDVSDGASRPRIL